MRDDFESYFNDAVPEDAPYWTHTIEGPDDMPAHIKASVLGPSLTLPVGGGRLGLGTWQGVYLCEHRDRGGARRLVATLRVDLAFEHHAAASRAHRANARMRAHQRPLSAPTGSRFSANAVAPSRASSELMTGPAISFWRSQASSSVQSTARGRICLDPAVRQRAVGDDRGGQLARGRRPRRPARRAG